MVYVIKFIDAITLIVNVSPRSDVLIDESVHFDASNTLIPSFDANIQKNGIIFNWTCPI